MKKSSKTPYNIMKISSHTPYNIPPYDLEAYYAEQDRISKELDEKRKREEEEIANMSVDEIFSPKYDAPKLDPTGESGIDELLDELYDMWGEDYMKHLPDWAEKWFDEHF